jgi:hypothetical protein
MHKKYIKKKGKRFGPYFYTTIRDKDGVARSYYLSQDKEVALKKEVELKEKMTREAKGSSFPAIPQGAYIAAVLVVALLVLSMGASFTGMFVAGDNIQYSQDLGLTFNQSTSKSISLQAAPDRFYLSSLALSGRIIGSGTAKVYIENPEGQRYLILDH